MTSRNPARFVCALLLLTFMTVIAGTAAAQTPGHPSNGCARTPPSGHPVIPPCPGSGTLPRAARAAGAIGTIHVGDQPFADAANPLNNLIWITGSFSNNVAMANGATNSATLQSTGAGPFGVAVNPVTNKIYIANNFDNTLTVLNATTGAFIRTITDSSIDAPQGIAINPVTDRIYVANSCSCTGEISVIDGSTDTVIARPALGAGAAPVAVAVNTVSNRIYVLDNFNCVVAVIDGVSNAILTSIPLTSGDPQGIAVNQVTNTIYVTDMGNATLTAINGATNTAGPPNSFGAAAPVGIAVDAATNTLYIADFLGPALWAVNGSSGTGTSETDPSLAGPYGVDVNPATGRVYVTNASTGGPGIVTVFQGVTGPAATAPTESCSPSTLPAGGSTTCTLALTSGVPLGGTVNKTLTAPSGAVISNCFGATGGLSCGSVGGTTSVSLTCASFTGVCAAGSVVKLTISGPQAGAIAQTVAVTPPGGGAAVSFMLQGPPPPSVNLVSSQNPSTVGQPVTFTATVNCPNFTPTGTVTFTIDGSPAGTVGLNPSGSAAFTTGTLSPGIHTVVATYNADSNCATSTSNTVNQQVLTSGSGVTLTSSQNPSTFGQSVTFQAVVSCNGGFSVTGTVTFSIDGTPGSPMTLNSFGGASLTTSTLNVGIHNVIASYSGNGNCAQMTSAPLTQTVNSGAPLVRPAATLTLASSQNASTAGQPVTFTATLVCSGFTPTGSISFLDGGQTLATVTLNAAGTASFTTGALVAGTHPISVFYLADANCNQVISSVLNQIVNAPAQTSGITPNNCDGCVPAAYNDPPPIASDVSPLSYCTPLLPPGAPCTPAPNNSPGGAAACAVLPALGQQQACIASTVPGVGAFICTIGCATASSSAAPPGPSYTPPPGYYCATPGGARQWVTQGAPVPPGCS